jgi:hypothetical protein
VLPRPAAPFKGHVGRAIKDSTKGFPAEVRVPKGTPNVLVILTDDVGGTAREVEEAGLLAVKGLARPVKALNIMRPQDPV